MDQLFTLWSHAARLKETIYQTFVHRLVSNAKFCSCAMRHSAGSNFTGEYLGEFETEFENILGR
jgi:hypothetical protein